MLIVACGDSFTQGEGLETQDHVYAHILAKKLKANIKNLSQSGASEYLILSQVEEAVKLKPDLILIGHTSEYRWQVWDTRNHHYQGFIVANHIIKNEKYYRNWILSEQILSNKRKEDKRHQAAWHAAGMLYYSEESVVRRLWKSAVALQSSLIKCKQVHINMFDHLQKDLEEITNNFINFPLDQLKYKEMAPDGSHAGPNLHKELAKLLIDHIHKTH